MPDFDLPRFAAKIEPQPNGCWLWTAGCSSHGYAQFYVPGRNMRPAHIVAFEHWRGPIPPGCELDHICRTTRCVNPWCCDPVTHAENVRRGEAGANNRAKTHCPRGHLYDYTFPSGRRGCNRCYAAQKRAKRAETRTKC
jgi:hypothetical protein